MEFFLEWGLMVRFRVSVWVWVSILKLGCGKNGSQSVVGRSPGGVRSDLVGDSEKVL